MPDTKKLMQRAHSHYRAIITMVVLYAIQFIILPFLLGAYFPGASNEAAAMFVASASVVLIVGFCFVEQRFVSWLIADAVYFGLIMLYCAEGAYGIGMRGISLDGMHAYYSHQDVALGALICVGVILIMQLILKGICSAACCFKHKC